MYLLPSRIVSSPCSTLIPATQIVSLQGFPARVGPHSERGRCDRRRQVTYCPGPCIFWGQGAFTAPHASPARFGQRLVLHFGLRGRRMIVPGAGDSGLQRRTASRCGVDSATMTRCRSRRLFYSVPNFCMATSLQTHCLCEPILYQKAPCCTPFSRGEVVGCVSIPTHMGPFPVQPREPPIGWVDLRILR